MKDTRTAILKAAYDMMGTAGLEEVHARTVAQAVKINHATVHYYFKTREDLLLGVAGYALEVLEADRKRFLAGAASPAERLAAELSLGEAYGKKGSRFARVLAGLVVASAGSPKVKAKVKALYGAWQSGIAAALAAAKLRRGALMADGELLAASLFGLALANLALDGGIDASAKLDAVYDTLLG